jgi:hypothetical protein
MIEKIISMIGILVQDHPPTNPVEENTTEK